MQAQDKIDIMFTYRPPSEEDIANLKLIRSKAKELARIIDHVVPGSPDKSAAIRKLRECVMTANAGIVLNGVS